MPRKQRRARAGSGSVYWSAKQARYVGEITLGYDDRGVRIRKVIVGPRGVKGDDARLGVEDRLRQVQVKRRPAAPGQPISQVRLGEYLDDWLGSKKKLSASASANYAWAIERHLKPALGNAKLRDIDRRQLKAFFSTLKLGGGGKGKVRTVLRAALNDAVTEHDLIAVNPMLGLDVNEATSTFKEVATWDGEQAKRFLRAAKETEHFPLFLLAIIGALGPAELFGILWKDVDLENGRVAIVRNLTEVGGRLILKETKTPSRRRGVALPRVVLWALKKRHRILNPASTDFVFTAPEGGGIRRTTFSARVWKPLLIKAKVPAITLYGMRHTSASLMAAMGVPLLFASRALGHSNIQTTANTYTHLFEESQRDVARRFDKLLSDL